MLHSRARDIIVKTSLEGNEDDTLAPGDRVAGLIHMSVLNDVRIKTLTVSSVGFEITYGKRNVSIAHPMRSLAAITHIPATVKDVKVFYARRTVVLEDSVLPCGSHTYSFRTRLPTAGLEPTLDTELVGVHYGITTKVTLPDGESVSSGCVFRVGSVIGPGPSISAGEAVGHGVRLQASAEARGWHGLAVTLKADRDDVTTGHISHAPEPKRATTKLRRQTTIGPDTTAEEHTVSKAIIPLGLGSEASVLLRTAPEGRRLVPTIPPGRAQLFSIGYCVRCKVQFERHRVHRPSSLCVSLPVSLPDEPRTSHMHGILGPDGIPVISQVVSTATVVTKTDCDDKNSHDDTETMGNPEYQASSNDVLGILD